MLIKISDSLTLGEWYQVPSKDWIRQDISQPTISTFAQFGSFTLPRVYFYPNVVGTFGLQFLGSLSPLRQVYKSIYGFTELKFSAGQEEEAKEFVDQFLIKMAGLKAFI